MGKENNKIKSDKIFNAIAPIYGLFYSFQIKNYKRNFNKIKHLVDISLYKNIIDIGCGTGALCNILNQNGLNVTGVDSVAKMLDLAKKNQNTDDINFVQANTLEGLPFADKSFDISITSYVAHGLKENERKVMYKEMRRITKYLVIIYDYNDRRSIITDIVEWLEGGDYFNFIKNIKNELIECFRNVKIVNIGTRTACYICSLDTKELGQN